MNVSTNSGSYEIVDSKCQQCGKSMKIRPGLYYGILCSECSKPRGYTSTNTKSSIIPPTDISECGSIPFRPLTSTSAEYIVDCEVKEDCSDRGFTHCPPCENNRGKKSFYKPRKSHKYKPFEPYPITPMNPFRPTLPYWKIDCQGRPWQYRSRW